MKNIYIYLYLIGFIEFLVNLKTRLLLTNKHSTYSDSPFQCTAAIISGPSVDTIVMEIDKTNVCETDGKRLDAAQKCKLSTIVRNDDRRFSCRVTRLLN